MRGRGVPSGRLHRPECVSCRPTTGPSPSPPSPSPGGAPARLGVGGDQLGAQGGQVVDRALVDDQLVGVGPPVGADGGGLGPHDPRPAGAEPPPAPAHEVGGAAVGLAVPSLHGQDAEPVGSPAPDDVEGGGQGPVRLDLGVDGEGAQPQVVEPGPESGRRAQRADLDDVGVVLHGGDHTTRPAPAGPSPESGAPAGLRRCGRTRRPPVPPQAPTRLWVRDPSLSDVSCTQS